MKILTLDDAVRAVKMLLDDEDDLDLIWSSDIINNLENAPSVREERDLEPRVMTLDEVLGLKYGTLLWIEEADCDELIPQAYASHFKGDPAELSDSDVIYVCFFGMTENTEDGYNCYWRCWTARPTDEQRKATPWEDCSMRMR